MTLGILIQTIFIIIIIISVALKNFIYRKNKKSYNSKREDWKTLNSILIGIQIFILFVWLVPILIDNWNKVL